MKYLKITTLISFIALIVLAVIYLITSSNSNNAVITTAAIASKNASSISLTSALIPLAIGILVMMSSLLMLSKSKRIRISVTSFNVLASAVIAIVVFSPWINCAGMMGGGSYSRTSRVSAHVTTNQGCFDENVASPDKEQPIPVTYEFAIEPDGSVYVCYTNQEALSTYATDINSMAAKQIEFYASDSPVSGNSSTIPPDLYPIFGTNQHFFPLFGSKTCKYGMGTEIGYLDMEDFEYYDWIVVGDPCGGIIGSAKNPFAMKREIEEKKSSGR